MAAFIKSLSRLLGSSGKAAPALYLSAFGKHPGWNDHIDDLGLDTDSLIAAKRLLYVQGINQNIDAGAWENLEQSPPDAPVNAIGRLDLFRHDFLWNMSTAGAGIILAGRLWSSTDGKGRDKYPMVLCAQLTELPDRFATAIILPFLAQVHDKCVSATSAETVRQVLTTERDNLHSHIKDSLALEPLTGRQLAAVAAHPGMQPNSAAAEGSASGFHRIVYQFAQGMSAYRINAPKSAAPRRPEHVRLPTCGMSPQDALLFWYRFALTFLDPATPLLLLAPDQGAAAPWVDLIAGEPAPANIFCIKAGTKSLPFTSDIPYTLDPSLVRAIDTHLAACASAPENAPLPPWPMLQ